MDNKTIRALVISNGESSRMTLSFFLKDFGIQKVTFVERLEDFKKSLEEAFFPFDLIISDLNLNCQGIPSSALDVLDIFRNSPKNSLRTAFIIVAGEAEYKKVADGIDGAVDDFLIKPFSCADFCNRLNVVLERKKVFEPIFSLMDSNKLEEAASLSLKLFEESPKYKIFSGRIATELLTATGQHEKTAEVFNILLKEKALPWTKLGIAKAELEAKNSKKARRSLEILVSENPSYVDAYDILGRSQIELLDFEAAFETYKKALEITPGNLQRVQKFASLAVVLNKEQEALMPLDRAFNSSLKTEDIDLYCVFLLAYISHELDYGKAHEKCERLLKKKQMEFPSSARIKTLLNFVEGLKYLRKGEHDQLTQFLDSFNNFVFKKDFDFETGCAALLFLKKIRKSAFFKNYLPDWSKSCFMRFNVSKVAFCFFENICKGDEALFALLKDSSNELSSKCQNALGLALEKQQKDAIQNLMDLSEKTLNTRVLNLAKSAFERYKNSLEPAISSEFITSFKSLELKFEIIKSGLKIGE